MRIGIITYHRAVNFGAALQVYALSRCLRERGHDVAIIDYNRTGASRVSSIRHKLQVALTLAKLSPAYAARHLVGRTASTLDPTAKEQQRTIHNKREAFSKHFASFRHMHLSMTERQYTLPRQLQRCPPECDAYIAGSDQIWSHGPTGFSDAYYLNFGRPDTLRVAYAPSFGASAIADLWKPSLRQHLGRFDAVSVRERSGLGILKDVGVKAVHVLDPTLLIDDYTPIMKPPDRSAFIFAYRLHQTPVLDAGFNGVMETTANVRGLDMVTVAPMGSYPHQNDVVMDVEEFLGHIASAQLVLTNSFHGTVFSVLLRRPFVCLSRVEEPMGQNDRMLDFLGQIGLQHRFIHAGDPNCATERFSDPIDWPTVQERLATLRQRSLGFLEQALTGKGH